MLNESTNIILENLSTTAYVVSSNNDINVEYLKVLKKEYESQDNRSTAYPIYVSVQELICIGVMRDGYSSICPYGDGGTRTEYSYEDYEGTFNSIEKIKEAIEFAGEDVSTFDDDLVEEFEVGYIWHPVEFFLTIKGAEEYMVANQHNHGKLRTYVHHFERRNYEMRELLEAINLNVKE
jgi:hypothetical protein